MAPYPAEAAESSVLPLELRDAIPSDVIDSALSQLLARDSTPSEVHQALAIRDAVPAIASRPPDHSGAVDPTSINMKGVQALFAIIGTAFVLGTIWFFFWAKNGGFVWRKGDWDDYKSTVLRRKGPNGTTLSNATKSTKLGGGSIVGDGFSDAGDSTISGTVTETMTDLSSNAPIIKEKQEARKARRETAKDRKMREARNADWEGGHDNDMRAYRHERAARVGGINKDSDAMYYGTDYTETDGSVVQSQTNGSRVNLNTRQSHARQPSPEKRQPSRRDFSYSNDAAFSVASSEPEYQAPPYDASGPTVPPHRPGRYHTPQPPHAARVYNNTTRPQSSIPGAYQASETSVSDVQNQNTKAYHHPLPNVHGGGAGRGFRRDRSDSLDD